MIPRRPVTLAVAFAAVLAAGCTTITAENPFQPAPTYLRLDESGAAAAVSLPVGRTLVIVLEANVTTGYRWEAVGGYAPTLQSLGTPDYTARDAQPGVVGAAGEQTFRFRAAQPGTTQLELVYRRPFEPNVAPARTVRYDVTVR